MDLHDAWYNSIACKSNASVDVHNFRQLSHDSCQSPINLNIIQKEHCTALSTRRIKSVITNLIRDLQMKQKLTHLKVIHYYISTQLSYEWTSANIWTVLSTANSYCHQFFSGTFPDCLSTGGSFLFIMVHIWVCLGKKQVSSIIDDTTGSFRYWKVCDEFHET